MTTAAQSWQAAAPIGGQGRKWWTLVAMCFGLFIALIDVTIVNVALPTIQRDLHASLSDLQWVVNAYVLSLAVFIVTAGRLGEILGRRRLFVIGMAVFILGSLFCGLSGSISIGSLSHSTVLHLARAFQGLGGAVIFPLSLAIISVSFQGKERGTALGIWGGIGGLATAIGPLVGGILVDKVSWQWIFYINVPIGIIGIFVTLWAVQESRDERASRTIDVFGLLAITVSILCLVLALIQGNDPDKGWTSGYILTLFAVAAVALIVFVIGELRLSSPMVDPRLFKNRSFTGAAIGGFALSAGMFSLFFFLALYLQDTLQFSALNAGLRFLPMSLFSFLAAPVAGRLLDRLGARALLTAGLTILTVSALLMARITPADGPNDWTVLLPGMILGGIGIGLALPPLSTLAVSTAPRWRAGMASGTNVMCRQVGNAFGIAFLGAILTHQVNSYVPANILKSAFPPGMAALQKRLASQLGSLGVTGSASAPAGVPHNPAVTAIVQRAVKAGFVDGIVDILHVAAIILAVGALCSLVLVRRKDMLGYGAPVTPPVGEKASPARAEGPVLQPSAS